MICRSLRASVSCYVSASDVDLLNINMSNVSSLADDASKVKGHRSLTRTGAVPVLAFPIKHVLTQYNYVLCCVGLFCYASCSMVEESYRVLRFGGVLYADWSIDFEPL